MDITIVGAGPIGCYAGYLLAQYGHTVSIYDKKKEIGLPIQCTGILTSDFDQFNISLDSCLVNTVTTIEAFSPNNLKIGIQQKDYIVCRKRFDSFLADKAALAGAKLFFNHSFVRREENYLVINDGINNTQKRIQSDIIIAADGPLSPVAKAYGLFHPSRKYYYGIQAVVEGNFENNVTKTYFGKDRCPGFFAWVVPESSTRARIGLYTTKNPKQHFDTFMFDNGFTAQEIQAGTIPIFNHHQKLKKGNCYVIGDASGYVKATTGGGIVPGMKQVQILVDCINNNKDFEKEILPLKKRMKLHLHISKAMNKFSDKDWNKLFRYVNQPKITKVFEQYSRDNPVPLVMKALLKEPRFLYFGKYLY
ncbi:NAD(P)/FAD-dependent oxidoreductase [Candidatus Woesearchaeota archaeon]|jgi:digeranylgeranylglycerophospholipid reductase|nr:NAD(P)/FAD-dependent oxidoreductase [Candidatus Woesearchaeota archaeon]MBT5396779.1 NAD(P)/FAD-dependent oxidoreductase [Candidatus Woesearchaeota archaeon]MBT5924525.1 NAD(P)/FAD-dependent oxidoreductase [Candidatus Woesearchaeota archaeon]MBT6367667.1 NAD(P)/FAD-dependent oxidoreductase [Candidatus Woesearchaeota archaeon]MBT7762932.1 NAD(P)/FAD-dependent oxidoreductase [Candidatus Woesearchaeota archaeon]